MKREKNTIKEKKSQVCKREGCLNEFYPKHEDHEYCSGECWAEQFLKVEDREEKDITHDW